MSNAIRILILCTGNSARSQMAESLVRELGGDRFEVHSAGTHPTGMNPLAVEAMREIGLDISNQWSKSVDAFRDREFDYVITVCDHAAENCPVFPGKTRRVHWGFEDPAAAQGTASERLDAFRRVRDQMRGRFAAFVQAPLLAIGADRVS
jgi:arsenate reductase (thioredoxin)